MRVAVIGATGMLGHHTALALVAAGHEPVIIHRPESDLSRIADVAGERRPADLDEPATLRAALDGVDAVVHSAAYYPTRPAPLRAHVERARTQIDAFIAAARDAAVARIVYVGASVALPRAETGQPAHAALRYEGAPPDPNAYLQVKWLMDDRCLAAAREGVPVSIAIPAMTLGEYDWGPSTGQFITRIANREMARYVEGRRNVIYAGDAGRGSAHVCADGRPGERYLLTGANVTMAELVAMIADKTGVPRPRPVPLGVARAVARAQALRFRLFGGAPPRLSDTAIAVMAYGQYLDGEKAERQLSFRAALRLEETLDRAIAWFRQVGYIPTLER